MEPMINKQAGSSGDLRFASTGKGAKKLIIHRLHGLTQIICSIDHGRTNDVIAARKEQRH
jgi:hypothetical protein